MSNKALVLGAGVIGLTTAYELLNKGYEVTVLEAQPGPAKQCSYANGGQLSYSHAEPWARPYLIRRVPAWLLDSKSPLFIKRIDAYMLKWVLSFLGYCRASKVKYATKEALALAYESKKSLDALLKEVPVNFEYQTKGTLHYYAKKGSFELAKAQAKFQETMGCHYDVLHSLEACTEREPALAYNNRNIIGGIYFRDDASGDVYQFCNGLADYLIKKGVKIVYNCHVEKLIVGGDTIDMVKSRCGYWQADAIILCAGAYSGQLAKQVGIYLPIYPLKGYSLTVDITGYEDYAPQICLTDQAYKVVASRLGTRLRVAGMAEFAGFDHSIDHRRVDTLKHITKTIFTRLDASLLERATSWSCLRPATPNCLPIIGSTPYANLYLNTGHGTLGWTMAAGSAKRLVNAI